MPPSANLRLRFDAHLFGSKARSPLQPGERTHTRMRWSTAAHVAARAGSLLSRAPRSRPLPHELHAPQSAPGCVAHTHTVGCPVLAAGGRRGGFHGRNGTRAARAFPPRDTPSPCPHTRSLAAAHGPHPAPHTHPSREACTPSGRASHPRVSLRVPALHSAFQPPVHPTSDQPRRSRTAHCTALALHCSVQLVAHSAEAPRA